MTRPAVAWFAEQMESKLLANDHKADWHDSDTEYLMGRLLQEVLELHQAYLSTCPNEEVVKEAADVANFAMMIADRVAGAFANRGRALK